jgi:hypothetical protein
MRKLSVSTLVSLDGVIQDPGGFGETEDGGWANPYFTADAEQGTQLFPQPGVRTTLQLSSARTLDSGVVNLTYVRAGRS